MTEASSPARLGAHYARGRLGRVNTEPTTWVFATLEPLVRAITKLITKVSWSGQDNLPATGPLIVTPNHISGLDPVLIGECMAWGGRWPHFLARADLFDMRVLGPLLRQSNQIPVFRATRRASDALAAAKTTLAQGKAIVIYPEGTYTFDPLEWPMAVHSGAARLALQTGAPVIPIGQWGANFALPPRKIRKFKLKRHRVRIVVGPPVELADLMGCHEDRAAVNEASIRILAAIIKQAEIARAATWPGDVWHPKRKMRVPLDQARQ